MGETLAVPKPGRVHPGVGVGALVWKDACLLMVRRAGAHGAGTWSVPGGWVELWEDPKGAAEREVLEETGIVVKAIKHDGFTDSQHRADGVHAVTLWVICSYVSGEPTVTEPEKCPEVQWVSWEQVGWTAVDARPLFHPFSQYWRGLAGWMAAGCPEDDDGGG